MEGDRSETRRLPRGERCSQCGDRKYYLESGMRFCTNGHEIEGFVQFDLGDEEDSGKMGAIARRDKEIRTTEKRTLTGLPGKSLYLEALQLILRTQLLWLINTKGFRPELETVVRDLWDLRIRGFGSLVPEEHTKEAELEVFSSQPLSENGDEKKGAFGRRSWDPERGSDWPMPRFVDTLGLCYLGCLLLKTPVRIGEISGWANGGTIPYKRAYYVLPQEMQDRMPSAYTRYIKIPLHTPLDGGELHRAVLDLAMSYHVNHELVFPGLSDVPLLVQYARLLALPVEAVRAARSLSVTLACSFQFPVQKSRIFPSDHPEIQLVSLLVIATKMCFPFKGGPVPLPDLDMGSMPKLDWQRWGEVLPKEPREQKSKVDYKELTADRIVSMSEVELDKYFKHLSVFIDKKNENPVTQFFPLTKSPPPEGPLPETTDDEVDDTVKAVLATALEAPQSGPEDVLVTKNSHDAYRTPNDLPSIARRFYEVAAEIAGVRLETLVQAVYMLEQRVITWQKRCRKAERVPVPPRSEADFERWMAAE